MFYFPLKFSTSSKIQANACFLCQLYFEGASKHTLGYRDLEIALLDSSKFKNIEFFFFYKKLL